MNNMDTSIYRYDLYPLKVSVTVSGYFFSHITILDNSITHNSFF